MEALFIGQTYIDVTFIADRIPTGDEKGVAHDYAISFGGNAVTAAFCCARLGIVPDLLTSLADDWLGRMFLDMAAKYQVPVHARKVKRSSLSVVMPNSGKRAILRLRDDDYLHPFPPLNLTGCRGLHLDGHQSEAALHYAKACREAGVFTSLDGGGIRSNTMELLTQIDAAVVSERFCEQLRLSPAQVLDFLKEKGCTIGAVTMGERGLLWYDEDGEVSCLPALAVPKDQIIDTNGAGDVFHGAYVYSRMKHPHLAWEAHFRFARAASAHAIRYLGNEARLPVIADIERIEKLYRPNKIAG
jgi:sugar/nucleoside kinase (ribokinase family)